MGSIAVTPRLLVRMLMLVIVAAMLRPIWAGKQRIIVKLREPLRAETVKIRLPEITNARGETRDLETRIELGGPKKEIGKKEEKILKLDMVLRPVGRNAIQVTVTLPEAGMVEVSMLDFYGKNLATLMDGQFAAGNYFLSPFTFKEADNNGIRFLALKINGKVVLKRVITKVR